jgi:hypothetical protein
MSDEKKVYKDVDSFVVERSKWLRGSPPGVLMDDDEKMCCLGFYAKACGFKDEDIRNVPAPYSLVYQDKYEWKTKLLVSDPISGRGSSEFCKDAINTNDVEGLSDSERESDLTDTFNKIGITLTFVD